MVEIARFRGIKALRWLPSAGLNCLIGPGDSSKSTILDAIDLCLGARRNVQFTDADFYNLDVSEPLSVTVTIGDLHDALKSIDAYGLYLRSFDASTGTVDDEPSGAGETVLSVNLTVASDLEPVWTLVSDRAAAQSQSRNLAWGDRTRLAPTRLGAVAEYNLSWRRGSVLNNLSEEKVAASSALVDAARDARIAFGDKAQAQLGQALGVVTTVANDLGIRPVGAARAMLDAHSVSFSGGTISLHSERGIPLRSLGLGSSRLLIAGLQGRAANVSNIVIIDELEHGLEPHRICRLLNSVGAKDAARPLQAFMTTHSPVAVRELRGDQLFVVRESADGHSVSLVGVSDAIQGTVRMFPEALLAKKVIVCEGASEVGLVRGLDQFNVGAGYLSIEASGTALIDAGGVNNIYRRVMAMVALGYRAAVLRDDDVQPDLTDEKSFTAASGKLLSWRAGRTLEDELFLSLSEDGVGRLLARAIDLHGEEIVDQHIRSASSGSHTLALCQGAKTPAIRTILGKASRNKKAGWFKSVTWMEDVARDIVGPDRAGLEPGFRDIIDDGFRWMFND